MSDTRTQASQAITRKWSALKHRGLDLGPAQGDLMDLEHGGWLRIFRSGRIYWHPSTGAREVHGGILSRYLEYGGHDRNPRTGRRDLGFPVTDEARTADGSFPVSKFEWGAIHWAHGGAPIYGAFYEAWKQHGSELGRLGYPLSDPLSTEGTRVVYFQGGCIAQGGPLATAATCTLQAPPLGKPEILHPTATGTLPVKLTFKVEPRDWNGLGGDADRFARLWRDRLVLQPVGRSNGAVALTVEADRVIDPLEGRRQAPGSGWDPEPEPGDFDVQVSLDCRVADGGRLADRTLYDVRLSLPGGQTRTLAPHALYTKASWRDFGFLHATDIHVSRRLDSFRSILLQKGRRESAGQFHNWNDAFRDLIRAANKLHDEGKIDFVMATGDLVDYLFEKGDPRRGGGNFAFFEQLVRGQSPYPDQSPSRHEPLRVPIFTTLGNHDYRGEAYELLFTVDIPAWWDKDIAQYSGFNLTKDDALAIQGGQPKLHRRTAEKMVDPVSPRYYYDRLGVRGSYVVELGPHRLVMVDTGPDVGVVEGDWDGFWSGGLGFGGEDKQTFISGSPNSKGVSTGDVSLLRGALQEAGSRGVVLVGMHAPPLNPKGHEYPHYFRETEHSSADEKETIEYLVRRDPLLKATNSSHPWETVDDREIERRARSRFPNWFTGGARHFKVGGTGDFMDYGVARGKVDDFLKLCIGQGVPRPADLVLFGHVHRHVEYRLEWDAREGKLRYLSDFYTENPGRYYPSRKVGFGDPVHLRVRTGSPLNASPSTVRDHRTGSPWREWQELSVPPYANPLSSASDAGSWWAAHRPLLMQTAPLGPTDQNQRRDAGVNPRKPGPALRGVRLVRVEDDVIAEVQRIPTEQLLSQRSSGSTGSTAGASTPPPRGEGAPRPRADSGESDRASGGTGSPPAGSGNRKVAR